jgi:N6-adenosine-specific RNA methylase IME4
MNAHPAADLFPMMIERDLQDLARDILENGQEHAIIVHDGLILDGRNRFAACQIAGVVPRTTDWKANGSPTTFVLSCNLQRRHLSPTQRAMIAAKAEVMFAAEAKERMRAAGRSAAPGRPASQDLTSGNSSDPLALIPNVKPKHEAREDAGGLLGVNAHYVTDAKRLRSDAPLLARMAESGLINMQQAKQLARLDADAQQKAEKAIRRGDDPRKVMSSLRVEKKRRIADEIRNAPSVLPEGQYRVIVIDPPWAYDQNADSTSKAVRGIVDYPDMSVDEICALPVGDLAYRDCALWLWTTNSFMRHAYACLDAWGFTEKTILTWDKVDMITGHYLRNVTEHCILAVRGRPVFDHATETTLFREKRRAHSQKPQLFYNIVDALCPGNKLEMFARQPREGYDAWGAETGKLDG